jgi:hypothetical protein
VWRTLPDLFIRPARLTRAYLDGHRAPQIPPFRLFLVVLVVVFFAGSLDRGATFGSLTSSADRRGAGGLTGGLEHMTPEARAKMKAMIENGTVTVYERSPGHGTTIGSVTSPAGATAKASVTRAPERLTPETWLKARMAQVLDDPRRFSLILESWAERFAFLTLPMAAVLISVTFVFQRRFFIFDHTIFSLHSLSAVGLMFAGVEALSPLIGDWANLILWGAPIHLFAHMRGVYGTSVIGTLARMAFLFMGSAVLGALIFMGLLLVGLNGMAA